MLGTLLGYDGEQQCRRYLQRVQDEMNCPTSPAAAVCETETCDVGDCEAKALAVKAA